MRITQLKVENLGKLKDFEANIGEKGNFIALVQKYSDEIPFEPTNEALIFRYLFDCWDCDEFLDEAVSLETRMECICKLETEKSFSVCITQEKETAATLEAVPTESARNLHSSWRSIIYPFEYSRNAVYEPNCRGVLNGIHTVVERYKMEYQNLLEPYNARTVRSQAEEVLTAIDLFIKESPAIKVNDSIELRLDENGCFVNSTGECNDGHLSEKERYYIDFYRFLLNLRLQKHMREMLGEETTYPIVLLDVFSYIEKEKWGFFFEELRRLGMQVFVLLYNGNEELEKYFDAIFPLSRK
ncbi:MAG: hypothetical protein IJ308_00440 [Clostridia bacterium]|nr:hypothetical protein [Clostridia bacterium]